MAASLTEPLPGYKFRRTFVIRLSAEVSTHSWPGRSPGGIPTFPEGRLKHAPLGLDLADDRVVLCLGVPSWPGSEAGQLIHYRQCCSSRSRNSDVAAGDRHRPGQQPPNQNLRPERFDLQ